MNSSTGRETSLAGRVLRKGGPRRMHASPPAPDNARELIPAGTTQAAIARASGMSPQAIGTILDGTRDPRLGNAVRIADAMKVPLERLARALVRAQEHARARAKARATVARLTGQRPPRPR